MKTHSAQAGLYLNIKKTKVMTTYDAMEFRTDGEKIEVDFLGRQISEEGSSSEEVSRRLNMCWRRVLKIQWTKSETNKTVIARVAQKLTLEGRIIKLRLTYFGHIMRKKQFGNGSDVCNM
eukprot:gene13977-4940_t